MLVLSRKSSECVEIKDRTTGVVLMKVMVVSIQGNKVRLGFQGPQSIQVMRTELLEDPPLSGPDPSRQEPAHC